MDITLRSSSASPVLGATVQTPEGEELGDVFDVVWDAATDRLRYAVSWLRRDKGLRLVPWAAVRFQPGERVAWLDVAPDKLLAAPQIDPEEWPRTTEPEWDREVYAHYGYPPYWIGAWDRVRSSEAPR